MCDFWYIMFNALGINPPKKKDVVVIGRARSVDDILNSLLCVDEKKMGAYMVIGMSDAKWDEFRKSCAFGNLPSEYVEDYIDGVKKWANDTIEEAL